MIIYMQEKHCNLVLDHTNQELNNQGTLEFPVAIYYDNLELESVPYHWHNELEVIVVITGEMEIVVELETFVLKPGEGIFINSGRLHSCTNYNNTACTLRSFVFHSKFIYGEINSVFYTNYFHSLLQETAISTCMLTSAACTSLLDAYDIFLAQEFSYEFLVRGHLSSIILSIIKDMENVNTTIDTKKMKQLNRCKQMMSYIHENFGEELTLLDIAQSADIKESECLRCFKSILNTSPIKYLKNYRLEQSAFLLKTTTKPIIEIGLSCGFVEMSYYSKSFREIYGMSPTKYRKQHYS